MEDSGPTRPAPVSDDDAYLALRDASSTQPLRFLSKEPERRDLLRIDPKSTTVPEEDPFPGVLPSGPAPPEGDWLTRLQERRQRTQAYIAERNQSRPARPCSRTY